MPELAIEPLKRRKLRPVDRDDIAATFDRYRRDVGEMLKRHRRDVGSMLAGDPHRVTGAEFAATGAIGTETVAAPPLVQVRLKADEGSELVVVPRAVPDRISNPEVATPLAHTSGMPWRCQGCAWRPSQIPVDGRDRSVDGRGSKMNGGSEVLC